LGGPITAQPILATNVTLSNGTTANVIYVGTENNVFYAVNADTGAVIWSNTSFGSALTGGCNDLPNGVFGITGTATFDKSAGIVYVADANDYVHALSMSTGVEQWKTNVLSDPNTNTVVGAPSQDHIYGALALNPNNGLLYAYTGSFCEVAPWHGRIVAIDVSTHNVVAAFFPGRAGSGKTGTAYCGGGIWGMGGASIDTSTNDVYVASGNIITTTDGGCTANSSGETYPYGDAVIQLDSQLNLISYQTANVNGVSVSGDSDYGATPMLYSVSNCTPLQLSAKNKNGYVYTYGVNTSSLTPEQQLHVGNTTSEGEFVGVPAFNASTGLVYVGNPNAYGNFAHGLNALQQISGGCSGLSLLWKASIGSSNITSNDNQAPTTANGVVYFADGLDNQVWAFNAASGSQLWASGTAIGSPCLSYGGTCGVLGAPTIDGRLFVGAWNKSLYAFGL
jgi:outer membrane protein assembly factor BamB